MASGILIIAIIVFAARGYFLSLPGVFARLIGLVSAYVVAFSFRQDVASIFISRAHSDVHPLLVQVISSAVLFFGTLFLVSLVIIGCFKLIARLVPLLRPVFAADQIGSRIGGATLNAGLGAALVLAGIWLYGLVLGSGAQPDQLQRFANRVGDAVFTLTLDLLADDAPDNTAPTTADSTTRVQQLATRFGAASPTPTPTPVTDDTATEWGTAEIRSSDNPDKHVFIERRHAAEQQPPAPLSDTERALPVLENLPELEELQPLLNNEALRKMAADPELMQKALDMLQSNPELLKNATDNPQLRALLENLQGDTP